MLIINTDKTMEGRFSFQKGFGQVKQKDIPAVRQDIMNALGITTRPNWNRRLKGEVVPKVTEAEAIEAIFAKYGVKEVWGAQL
jgi:hypothetical protein